MLREARSRHPVPRCLQQDRGRRTNDGVHPPRGRRTGHLETLRVVRNLIWRLRSLKDTQIIPPNHPQRDPTVLARCHDAGGTIHGAPKPQEEWLLPPKAGSPGPGTRTRPHWASTFHPKFHYPASHPPRQSPKPRAVAWLQGSLGRRASAFGEVGITRGWTG